MAKSNRDRPIWKGCQTGKEADECFLLRISRQQKQVKHFHWSERSTLRDRELQRVWEGGAHLARATLILQPPLKSFSFLRCMAGVKPRPWRIREALVSALSASSSSRRS